VNKPPLTPPKEGEMEVAGESTSASLLRRGVGERPSVPLTQRGVGERP